MSDDKEDVTALDPAERKGRLEIRLVLVVIVLMAVVGGLWVAVKGSPTADRRALDSSDTRLPGAPTPENSSAQ